MATFRPLVLWKRGCIRRAITPPGKKGRTWSRPLSPHRPDKGEEGEGLALEGGLRACHLPLLNPRSS